VVDRYATLLHQFFHMAITQGVRDIPSHTDQDNVFGEMRALEADHRLSPLTASWVIQREIILSMRPK